MNLDDSLNCWWAPADPKFRALLRRFTAQAEPIYVVGGAVRDAMAASLTQNTFEDSANTELASLADIDIALPAFACETARKVANQEGWAFYKLDAERDIARLVFTDSQPPLVCDVARFQGDGLPDDLTKRDFTINAMAFEVAATWGTHATDGERPDYSVRLIDRHDGLRDLQNGQIRRVTEDSLHSDPVRLLRAVRFAAQLSQIRPFEIEPATRQQIIDNAGTIAGSSQERIRDELWKALATADPALVIEELRLLGLLQFIVPEVADLVDVPQSAPHHLDVYQHTLSAVRHAGFLRDWILRDNEKQRNDNSVGFEPHREEQSAAQHILTSTLAPWREHLRKHFSVALATGHRRSDWLVWLALFHDVGKPSTRTEELDGTLTRQRFFNHEHVGAQLTSERLKSLHFSRDESKLAIKVVENHMRPHHLHHSFADGDISQRACYRFFRDAGRIQDQSPVGIDVVMVALADTMAIYPELNGVAASSQLSDEICLFWQEYVRHAEALIAFGLGDNGDSALRKNRLLSGHHLMEKFGIEPGPRLGQILEQVVEAQAAGEIETEEEALIWVANRLPEFST